MSGVPAHGCMPLRGQANVQGATDMQGHLNALPGYHSITDPVARAKFEKAWGVKLPENRYLSLIEMEAAAVSGDIRAMYIMGDNPVGASPDTATVEAGIMNLEFLVVQDLFMSDTARWPTSFSRPRHFPRRRAPSPTPSAACSSCRRPSRRPARRGPTGRSCATSRPPWATNVVPERSCHHGGDRLAGAVLRRYPPRTAHQRRAAVAVPRYLASRHALPLLRRFPSHSGRASFTVLNQQRAVEIRTRSSPCSSIRGVSLSITTPAP